MDLSNISSDTLGWIAVAVIIAFFLILFAVKRNSSGRSSDDNNMVNSLEPVTEPAGSANAYSVPVSDEDEETVAAIIAAIMALGDAEGKNYEVKSIRKSMPLRQRSGRSAWAEAGLYENTAPF